MQFCSESGSTSSLGCLVSHSYPLARTARREEVALKAQSKRMNMYELDFDSLEKVSEPQPLSVTCKTWKPTMVHPNTDGRQSIFECCFFDVWFAPLQHLPGRFHDHILQVIKSNKLVELRQGIANRQRWDSSVRPWMLCRRYNLQIVAR